MTGTYWQVYHEQAAQTAGGLEKEDLVLIDTTLNKFVFRELKEYEKALKSPIEFVAVPGKMVISKKEFTKLEANKKHTEEIDEKLKRRKIRNNELYNAPTNVSYIRPKMRYPKK